MQLQNLFTVHSDTFRHVQETFEVPLSEFQPINPSSFDLVLVIPLRRKEVEMAMVHVLERIISTCGRKYVYMYNNHDETLRFVLIRGGSTRLRSKAEQTGTTLPLDDRQCLLLSQEGIPEANIGPICIAHSVRITPLKPFEYLHAKYITKDDKLEAMYRTVYDGGVGGLFQKADRIRLLDRMLNDSEADDGANVNIPQLLDEGSLLAYFPLHSAESEPQGEGSFAHDLASWGVPPWSKPLDELNDYFGSRIAFNLAFKSYLSSWLVLPAIFGIGCQIAAVIFHNYSRPEIPVFAFVVAAWAVLVHEHWKRQEMRYAMQWNSLGPEEGGGGGADTSGDTDRSSTVRPDFRGIMVDHSHIDGRPTLWYPRKNFVRDVLLGAVAVVVVVLCTIGVVASIYVIRWQLYSTPVGRFNQFAASGINAVTILLLQYAFRAVAVFLTQAENHRTDSTFHASLTWKLVLFGFVNNFTAFYYLAFGARYLPQGGNRQSEGMCGYDDCMVSLAINLATLLGLRLVVQTLVTRLVPYVLYALKHGHCTCLHAYHFCRRLSCVCVYRLFLCRRYYAEDDEVAAAYEVKKQEAQAAQEEKAGEGELAFYDRKLEEWGYTRAEWELSMPAYDTDYLSSQLADQFVTFGLVTLFAAALPAALSLGLLYYMSTFNGDCWMLLRRYRRPWPSKASGLGHCFHACLGVMVALVVATNAALVSFTMQTLDGQTMAAKLGVFVAFQYSLFAFRMALSAYLGPIVPSEVSIQLARQAVVVRKLIDRVPDKHRVTADGAAITPVAVL